MENMEKRLEESSMEIINKRIHDIDNEIELSVYNMLQKYTNSKFKMYFSVSREYTFGRQKEDGKRSYLNLRAEIYFLDDNKKEIFGSSFMIYWQNGRLEMNHGCMGQFSKNDKGLVNRCLIMGMIWNNVDEVEYILEKLDLKHKDEYLELLDIQAKYYEKKRVEEHEEDFKIWLEEYKVKLSNMYDHELKTEKRKRNASAKKYHGVEPRILIALQEESDNRKRNKDCPFREDDDVDCNGCVLGNVAYYKDGKCIQFA